MEAVKYPRTPHLPFSLGSTNDDRFITTKTLKFLKSGIELVVTEKMDGGNLSLYKDNFHARSLSSHNNPWDSPAKALWSSIKADIPDGWRITGESMYAERSIKYSKLESVFLIFGIWNEKNELLSWSDTEYWSELLDLKTVKKLYQGDSYEEAIKVWFDTYNPEESEGFVLRNSGSFHYDNFSGNIGKYVRANHVTTDANWRKNNFNTNAFISK